MRTLFWLIFLFGTIVCLGPFILAATVLLLWLKSDEKSSYDYDEDDGLHLEYEDNL